MNKNKIKSFRHSFFLNSWQVLYKNTKAVYKYSLTKVLKFFPSRAPNKSLNYFQRKRPSIILCTCFMVGAGEKNLFSLLLKTFLFRETVLQLLRIFCTADKVKQQGSLLWLKKDSRFNAMETITPVTILLHRVATLSYIKRKQWKRVPFDLSGCRVSWANLIKEM